MHSVKQVLTSCKVNDATWAIVYRRYVLIQEEWTLQVKNSMQSAGFPWMQTVETTRLAVLFGT